MAIAKAQLNSLRISPRKVRLVADAVRGNSVSDALAKLMFLNKRASVPVKKLLVSALANAKAKGVAVDGLIIEKITVDGGDILYRNMPRARGSAFAIRKRTSHIALELGEAKPKKK